MSKEKEGEYSVLEVNRVRYVLVKLIRNGTAHPQPNFMGSKRALVAILEEGETLGNFLNIRYPKIKESATERAEIAFKEVTG